MSTVPGSHRREFLYIKAVPLKAWPTRCKIRPDKVVSCLNAALSPSCRVVARKPDVIGAMAGEFPRRRRG